MRKFLATPVFLLCMMLTSCVTLKSCSSDHDDSSPQPPPSTVDIPKQITAIQDVRQGVEAGVASVKGDAGGIKNESATGKKDFPKAPQWDFIDKKADSIIVTSDVIDKKVKDLNAAAAELTVLEAECKRQKEFTAQAQKALTEEKAKSAKLAETIKTYEDSAKKRQQTIWMTVSGFSALGLLIGIFLFIYAKSELGIALAVSSLITACVSYFMAAYALIVAMIGGGILLLVIGYLIWYLFQNKRALVETVKNFEDIKHVDWSAPGVKDKVSFTQSPSTKKIIHEIRMEEGLK